MSAKADSLRRIADALELQNQPIELLQRQIEEQRAEIDQQKEQLERAMSGWRGWYSAAEQLKSALVARQTTDVQAVKTAREALLYRDDAKDALRRKTSECIERELDLRQADEKIRDLERMLCQKDREVAAANKATRAAEAKLSDYHDPWDMQRAGYEVKIKDLRARITKKVSALTYWKSKAARMQKAVERYKNAQANTRR